MITYVYSPLLLFLFTPVPRTAGPEEIRAIRTTNPVKEYFYPANEYGE
jgi:hypothetical protein